MNVACSLVLNLHRNTVLKQNSVSVACRRLIYNSSHNFTKKSSPTQHCQHIKTHLLEDFPVIHFYDLCSNEEKDPYWHVAEIKERLQYHQSPVSHIIIWRSFKPAHKKTCFFTHHIIIWINLIVASLRASKNSRRICPFSPIFPMTRPNTMQNTRSPKMLAPSTYVPMIL